MQIAELKVNHFYTKAKKNKPVIVVWEFVGFCNHRPVFRMYTEGVASNHYSPAIESDVESMREIEY